MSFVNVPLEGGGGGLSINTTALEKTAKTIYSSVSLSAQAIARDRAIRQAREQAARYAAYVIYDRTKGKEREVLEEEAEQHDKDIYTYIEDEFKSKCKQMLDDFITAIRQDVEEEIEDTNEQLAAYIARLEAITYELQELNRMMEEALQLEAQTVQRKERILTNKNYLTYLYNHMGELYTKYGLDVFNDMTDEDWAEGNAFEQIFNQILYDPENLFDDITTIQQQEDLYNLINAYKDLLNQRYKIKWFRKDSTYTGVIDKQAGLGWEPLNDTLRPDGGFDGTTTKISTSVTLKPVLINTDNAWALIVQYIGKHAYQERIIDPDTNTDAYLLHEVHQFKIGQTILECDIAGSSYLPTYWTFDSMIYNQTNLYNFETSVIPKINSYYSIPVTVAGQAPTVLQPWNDEIASWTLNFGGAVELQDIADKIDANNPYEYWINTSQYQLVTRNQDQDLVLIESDTSPFVADRNAAIPLNETYYQYLSELHAVEESTNEPAKYVLDNPTEIFTLNDVDLDPKKAKQTFKVIASYDNTFITSNEVTFTNQSTDYLVEQFSDLNSKFKVQLVRPRYESLNEKVPPENLFGGSFVADDSVSEFFVFDERGHAIENPDGIPYDSVTYYAFLMMRSDNDEELNYSIVQYNQPIREAIAAESNYLEKLKVYDPDITDELAQGYLSEWDKKVIAAYLNITSFDDTYATLGRQELITQLTNSVRSQIADDLTASYAIDWNMDITAHEVNPDSSTMFNYLHRMTTEQVNERFGFHFAPETTVFVLEFRIKDSYSLSSARPIDRLALRINYGNVNYIAEREFHFGNASTMGSNYNISIMVKDHSSELTNAPILKLDKYHMIALEGTADDTLGTYYYDLIANIRKKNGLPLSDEERAKCQIYWYLNSGLNANTDENYYEIHIDAAGTLYIQPLSTDFFNINKPITPPIITLRVDGLESYSLYYSVPFQVWKTANALDDLHINSYSVSCPNRIAFNSSGTNPAYDKSAFEVVDHNNSYVYVDMGTMASSIGKTLKYNASGIITNIIELRRAIRLPDEERDIEFDQYLEYSNWTWRRQRYSIIEANAELIPEVNDQRYTYITEQQALIDEECAKKEAIIDEYEASLKAGYIPVTLDMAPVWTLTFKYRNEESIVNALNESVGTVVNNIGTNYFMNLDTGSYENDLHVDDWIRIKTNDSELGTTYSLLLVDGENTQWEDKLRDAHAYLSVKLRDGTWVTQAIVFERQVYCSSLVNAWGGTEITIDNNNNTSLSKRIVVGSKDSNNAFTGMLMGDWSGDVNDGSIDTPGIYGFKAGAQTYGLLTSGEAFFGAAGAGRIYINKHAGVISNANMTSYINLNPRKTDIIDDNSYDIRAKGYSPYFLYTESEKSDVTAANVNWNDLLSIAETKDVFAVDPHRGVFMSGGIRAGWGDIGGWQITDAGLTKKKNNSKIYLGVGNKTSTNKEFAEELYLYLIKEIYLVPSHLSKAEVLCEDHSLLTEINKLLTSSITLKDGTTTQVLTGGVQIGTTYGLILSYIHKYLLILLRDEYSDVPTLLNHFFPSTATHQVTGETKSNFELFRDNVAEVQIVNGSWVQPENITNIFYYLNTMIPLHKILYSDGYIEQYRYKFIYGDSGVVINLKEHEQEIEIAYAARNSSGSLNENDDTGNYYIWSGPAAVPMSKQNKGTFSVDYNGDLYAESGTIGGWGFTDTKLYSTIRLQDYIYDETGRRKKNSLGQYIRTESNSFIAELDVGMINGSAGVKYPYFALLNKSILLESGSGGAENTFARMGFYYDPTLHYNGRMLRRIDLPDIPYEIDQETGQIRYANQIILPYYNDGRLESYTVNIEPHVNGPTYVQTGGYNIAIDGTRGTIRLGECMKREVHMVQAVDENNEPVLDENDNPVMVPAKDEFGNIIYDDNYYPAIELNGQNGTINLYHNNVVLDGKANRVSIGVYDDNGEIELVGFKISSSDYSGPFEYITWNKKSDIEFTLGPDSYQGASVASQNGQTTVTANLIRPDGYGDSFQYYADQRIENILGTIQLYTNWDATDHYDGENDETHTKPQTPAGVSISLTDADKVVSGNYVLYGSELRFILNTENSYMKQNHITHNNQYLGFSAVAGWKEYVDEHGDIMQYADDEYTSTDYRRQHIVLTPTGNLVNGAMEVYGLLYKWNLAAQWVNATQKIYAGLGCYGPDGIYASLNYVNQKLADLAGQISSLASKLNGNMGNLTKLIQAVAGGPEGLDKIVGGTAFNGFTFGDFGGQSGGTTNLMTTLSSMQSAIESVGSKYKEAATKLDDNLSKKSDKGHTHSASVECGTGGASGTIGPDGGSYSAGPYVTSVTVTISADGG